MNSTFAVLTLFLISLGGLLLFYYHINEEGIRGSTTSGCTLDNQSYDYFQLVLQWPPGFGSELGDVLGHWTIHGLWPSREQDVTTYPCDCSNVKYDDSIMSVVQSDMKYFWPSLVSGHGDSPFWAHEWEKHGTCSVPFIRKQLDYFQKTLQLRKSHDPTVLLGSFQPSTSVSYPYIEMQNRLGSNGKVIMHCNNPGTNAQSLKEVVLCIKAINSLDQFSCPQRVIDYSPPLCNPNFPIWFHPAKSISSNFVTVEQ